MADLVLSAARIGLALFLVFLNGFFVAAEFAFVRLRSASVETLVGEGRRTAPVVREATENLDDYLAVSQLGITISSLGLGWVGEPAVAVVVEPLLAPVLPSSLLHAVTVGIGFGIVTFFHVVTRTRSWGSSTSRTSFEPARRSRGRTRSRPVT